MLLGAKSRVKLFGDYFFQFMAGDLAGDCLRLFL